MEVLVAASEYALATSTTGRPLRNPLNKKQFHDLTNNQEFVAHCSWLYACWWFRLNTLFKFKQHDNIIFQAKSDLHEKSKVKHEHRQFQFHLAGDTYGAEKSQERIWDADLDFRSSKTGVNLEIRDDTDDDNKLIAQIHTSYCLCKHSTVFFYKETDPKWKPVVCFCAEPGEYYRWANGIGFGGCGDAEVSDSDG
ncbi:MAG: hypothetical protein Q9162_002511 [Coniocarpon cinnabarinum]